MTADFPLRPCRDGGARTSAGALFGGDAGGGAARETTLALPCPAPAPGPPDPPVGYARSYEVDGRPGVCALQRVETRIRLWRGDQAVVDYWGRAFELFRWEEEDDVHLDVHDFDLRRDGWSAPRLRRLLRRHGVREPAGPARLEYAKSFTIGLAEAEGVVDAPRTPGFGWVAEGPDGPTEARLLLVGGSTVPARAIPPRARAAGRARWVASEGWGVTERFGYVHALLRGSLDDGGGYAPLALQRGAATPPEQVL